MWEKMEIVQALQEAIVQTPSYEKFLKDALVKKEKLEVEPVILIVECSVVLQQNLPAKMADLESFSIPCQLGSVAIPSALCDLGASVSLLPKTTYDKLNVGELKPTKMILQLADKSVKAPLGTLEDVPLKVENVYVPIDFVVIDMDNKNDESVILGRPFLNTVDVVIHFRKGCIEMHIGDTDIEFKLEQKPERGKEEHEYLLPIPEEPLGSPGKQTLRLKDKGKGIAYDGDICNLPVTKSVSSEV
ncbi:PREDICTED: uncharacterized protein LOC104811319 [Tarenaya hassleriana]|uniref:uncharacterized protein LOC104811319 n=1 Tax=Tarenaya hassleriana TaxID=28532 RepID=UPI00053C3B54|nr:PREDICTED: uncharacterized protein LOC104811319 [Tarenaya hassleriana]